MEIVFVGLHIVNEDTNWKYDTLDIRYLLSGVVNSDILFIVNIMKS